MDATQDAHALLLVEDNPGDADLVREYLDGAVYRISHATRLAEAVRLLGESAFDVVLLDLRLPDTSGIDGVRAIRKVAAEVPIVVLTGTDDERLAHACLDAGAQDYLQKGEIRANTLRRAIGYAITRVREAQMRALTETLAQYRAMASASSGTSITAALAGSGSISERSPRVFAELTEQYGAILDTYLDHLAFQRSEADRAEMERLVTRLGDAAGGPRDLLDVHLAALHQRSQSCAPARARAVMVEGRLLALEMMGLLVDYYRVGQRVRSRRGPMS